MSQSARKPMVGRLIGWFYATAPAIFTPKTGKDWRMRWTSCQSGSVSAKCRFSERVVYREMFPAGLTLLDLTEDETGPGLTMSHVAARAELTALLAALQLPGLTV